MELSEWREELAGVLAEALYASDVNLPMADPLDISCRDVGDALAPVVARLLAEVRAEALRDAAEALDLRRLGMAFSDPWREGWNRALEVIRDDLRTNAHPTDDHAGEAK